MKNPDSSLLFNDSDLQNDAEILKDTLAIESPINPNELDRKKMQSITTLLCQFGIKILLSRGIPRKPTKLPKATRFAKNAKAKETEEFHDAPTGGSKSPDGNGPQSVILPSNPNELGEMLDLRFASFNAGTNGVRTEKRNYSYL